ncbi:MULTISPECIES: hypothetical protein [Streptomyces]|uniref:Uncharacterized protein n=4 Tax=Streptomyces TaxID=1883 RepID=A0A927BL03_STRGL|nr:MULTISPECIES: hypothetical protein [Streptomyces]MBD2829633.1 hypothetical protein [Streptomyces globisporus]MYW81131.1 hypothetical protein [Streptomyces sp. SID8369]MBD3556289.1 hypothetical protein [Streptomyces sp. SP18CM02]MCC0574262.1 hypothetical protein [Streptomyces californicus]MDW4899203.1 hypothetical protein [Streptomyces californicus]
MPLISEEPQIPESAQGPRVTPATGRTAPTPRPVPGPRSAATPRPGRPGPGPARPAPPAQRAHPAPAAPARPQPTENRSAPQVQLIPAPAAGALDAAEEAVDLLLESGRAPGDILVLTTGEQHPWAVHELSFGEAAYWAQQDAGDDVFFADASAVDRAKPRPVVVVAANGDAGDAVARALPVARDRAAALLIVCGDPQTINSALGAGV